MRNTTITIDQHALAHNLNIIKNTRNPQKPAKVMAMVKANAYGHGIATAVLGLKDADAFGVACMSEALEVKQACDALGLNTPIVLIEGVFSEEEWYIAKAHNFGCVIHNHQQLNHALTSIADDNSFTRTIWLKYNTGMNRLGFDEADVVLAAQALHQHGYQLILTSHFACADEKDSPVTKKQISRFHTILDQLRRDISPDVQASLCNSAGIFQYPDEHHDWVRTGIALYGSSPFAHISSHTLKLKPAMIFMAHIMAIQQVDVGESVSYGALWCADKPSRIGIISCGYGDGYPRVVEQAKVGLMLDDGIIHAPVVGRVAMDIMMIDVTDIQVEVGTPAILWGVDGAPSIDDVAGFAGTIGYELMCRTTPRPIRQVIGEKSII